MPEIRLLTVRRPRVTWVSIAVLTCVIAFAGAALAAQKAVQKKGKPGGGGDTQTTILRVTFNDNHALGAGTDYLISDRPEDADGFVAYTDRRWPGAEGDPDRCISARLMNAGGSFVHMNQGSSMPDECNLAYLLEARTYTMRFDAGSCACAELNLGDDGDGYCSMTVDVVDGAARIRTSPLFKKNSTTASIDFVFRHDAGTPLGSESFELQSEENLRVDAVTNDISRLVRVDEPFQLISLQRGELCTGIDFALDVEVERR